MSTATITDKANVRSGPGTHYPAIGWVAVGREVAIIGGAEKWSKVKILTGEMKGKIGWIHDDLLRLN